MSSIIEIDIPPRQPRPDFLELDFAEVELTALSQTPTLVHYGTETFRLTSTRPNFQERARNAKEAP